MKNQLLSILSTLFLMLPNLTSAQVVGISSPGSSYEMTFIPGEQLDNSADFKRIAPKMYLTDNYLASKVDNINETIFLKYNIYKDEMEFSKDGQILFLKKENGRKISFENLNQAYEVFEFENKLTYFMVHNDDKNQLLSRKIVRFQKKKLAKTSYQTDKLANFIREKDVFYIKFDNTIKELSSKKRKFYDVFGNNTKAIKEFVKSNKINIKDMNGLEKVITYLNTI